MATKADKKTAELKRKHRYVGEFFLLGLVWFTLWLGSISDSWVRSALIFTVVFALLELFGDLMPDKEKKDEVSEVRKEDGQS